jgi:hypothetical protein
METVRNVTLSGAVRDQSVESEKRKIQMKTDQVNSGTEHHGVPSPETKPTPELKAAPAFTAGPWEIDPKLRTGHEGGKHSYLEVAAAESALWLARVQSFSDDKGEFAANAHLIAAAPALYEAAKAALDFIVDDNPGGSAADGWIAKICDDLRAALALARGEVPEEGER